MATYKQVQDYVRSNFGYTPKTCWIAHCKEIYGLAPRKSHRRLDSEQRKYPCPEEKRPEIEKAFKAMGMIG